MTWHATTDLIEDYLQDRLDPARCGSLEQHVLACGECRRAVASAMPDTELDALWADVIDAVDRPRPLLVERVLGWLGVRAHVARLLAATPSLRLSWLAGLVLTLAAAVIVSFATGEHGDAPVLFLMITPLLPLLGIAVAYGPGVDPAFEVSTATPYPSVRLFLYRSLAVLITSIALTTVAATFLPLGGWEATLWLLPALAATAATLALSTWVTPTRAAMVTAFVWVTGLAANTILTRTEPGDVLEHLIVFQPGGQLGAVLVILAAAVVFAVRLDRFDTLNSSLPDPIDIGV